MAMKTMVTLVAGLGLSLAACNGSVTSDTTGSGGNGTTSSATTGSSTGSGGACAGFEDAPGSGLLTVRFHNETGLPVYLPGRCEAVDYTIVRAGGNDGVSYSFDGSCLQTCSDLQTQPPYACGACAPRAYLLAPGKTVEVTWDGTGLLYGVAMPTACYAQPEESTCDKIVSAPAASYTIQAGGFSSCGAGCTCDANGVCGGSAEGQQAYADPVKFDFPNDKSVDVVFGVCAFGCAGG